MQKFSGMDYLKIDIASNFGLDKETWDTRLAWFDQHEDRLLDLIKEAKEPALFYAGIQAWNAAQRGEASGYPISLDATASGLQLLAALTGDRSAGKLCNVVPDFSDEGVIQRRDGYTLIYSHMLGAIGDTAKITREQAKDAVMTSLYGSTAVPREVFGEGRLLNVFYDTMGQLAPAAWELNQAFLDLWNPDALSNDWVLPDNFHVHVKVMDQETHVAHFLNEPFEIHTKVNAAKKNGRSLGANTIHSVDGMIVREMARRCNYDPQQVEAVLLALHLAEGVPFDPANDLQDTQMVRTLWKHYEESGYLSARIFDYLHSYNAMLVDADVVRELIASLPKKPFRVVSVHDCFRCLPNYGNDLREQYILQLTLIAKSNLLSFLLSQLVGRQVQIGKLDPTMWQDIQKTEYALS